MSSHVIYKMTFDMHKQGKIVEWVQKDADGISKCRQTTCDFTSFSTV